MYDKMTDKPPAVNMSLRKYFIAMISITTVEKLLGKIVNTNRNHPNNEILCACSSICCLFISLACYFFIIKRNSLSYILNCQRNLLRLKLLIFLIFVLAMFRKQEKYSVKNLIFGIRINKIGVRLNILSLLSFHRKE